MEEYIERYIVAPVDCLIYRLKTWPKLLLFFLGTSFMVVGVGLYSAHLASKSLIEFCFSCLALLAAFFMFLVLRNFAGD